MPELTLVPTLNEGPGDRVTPELLHGWVASFCLKEKKKKAEAEESQGHWR